MKSSSNRPSRVSLAFAVVAIAANIGGCSDSRPASSFDMPDAATDDDSVGTRAAEGLPIEDVYSTRPNCVVVLGKWPYQHQAGAHANPGCYLPGKVAGVVEAEGEQWDAVCQVNAPWANYAATQWLDMRDPTQVAHCYADPVRQEFPPLTGLPEGSTDGPLPIYDVSGKTHVAHLGRACRLYVEPTHLLREISIRLRKDSGEWSYPDEVLRIPGTPDISECFREKGSESR